MLPHRYHNEGIMADLALYQDINYGGWDKEYDGDTGALPDGVDSQASSLRVVREGWITFYSKPDYSGSELYVRGPFEVPDLTKVVKHNGPRWLPVFDGNWNDAIRSFKVADTRPQGSGTYVNDSSPGDAESRAELMQFISSMPHIDVKQDGTVAGQSQTTEVGEMQFTTTNFQSTLTVTELAGFNPNIGVIWPGALVQGDSLSSGILAAINVERTPLTLLLSTLGIPSGVSVTPQKFLNVFHPNAASVEAARSDLVQQGFVVPAKLAQVFKQFYSLDHAMMELGASASYLGSSIKAQLSSEKFSSQSNVMVAFTQEYYTIAADAPTSPISYFGETVTKETLQPYSDTSVNPVTYVQSVTYGRLALLLATSTVSYDDLERSISAAVRFATGSADAHYGDSEKKIVTESDVKMLLLGGKPDSALVLIPTTQEALTAMSQWLNQPITSTPKDIQLGVPISYRVNYLRDNQVARLSFTTSYHRVQSSPIPQLTNWTITFQTADDDKDNDTALLVEVRAGGAVIAHHSENGEGFGNGSTKTRRLDQDRILFARNAGAVQLHIRIDPNGNDTWDFSFTLTATNTGGGSGYVKSGHMRLSQDNRDGYA
jgi:thiol-activated cytolysin